MAASLQPHLGLPRLLSWGSLSPVTNPPSPCPLHHPPTTSTSHPTHTLHIFLSRWALVMAVLVLVLGDVLQGGAESYAFSPSPAWTL